MKLKYISYLVFLFFIVFSSALFFLGRFFAGLVYQNKIGNEGALEQITGRFSNSLIFICLYTLSITLMPFAGFHISKKKQYLGVSQGFLYAFFFNLFLILILIVFLIYLFT